MNRVGICFNIEPGRLENQAKVLVRSIRKFGEFQTTIYAFQPRRSGKLSDSTKQLFKEYNVIFEKVELNKRYYFNRMANKVLVPAYFETKYCDDYDTIAYFDTDLLINKPLKPLFDIQNKILVATIHVASYSAISREEKESDLWNLILDHLQITTEDLFHVTSTYDQKEIYQYFNGGLWIIPSKFRFFSKLKSHYFTILENKKALRLSPREYFFIDQVLFSVLLAKEKLNKSVHVLSKYYNYPLELTQKDVNNAHIIHFQDYFTNYSYVQLSISDEVKTLIEESYKKIQKSRWWLRYREILSYQVYKISFLFK